LACHIEHDLGALPYPNNSCKPSFIPKTTTTLNESLILASASPRRQALLQQLGVSFEVIPADVDETVEEGLAPDEIVRTLAARKAQPVSDKFPSRLVLAADTIVVIDDSILEKPGSPAEAVRMLSALRGQTHAVLTGVALYHGDRGRKVLDHELTEVTFGPVTDDEIQSYVAGGSPMDKAGAYGIQDDRGSLFIRSISGDYYNVVGLPLNLIYRLTRRHFPDLAVF
jgi:septum formation protein